MKALSERANGATLALIAKQNLKPIHDMNTTPQASAQRNPRIYVLRPFPPVAPTVPKARVTSTVAAPAPLPPRQPLPTAVLDPNKPMLKLGLDVHLEFIVAVGQKDHGNPQAPRKFTPEQLVAYVGRCVAEGLQVFCVQESCGFGFVLHRQSAPVPNPSSSLPSPSTAGARPTSSTPASCACACPAGWTATATNSVLSASPPKPSSACARAAAAANSWPVRSAAWPIGGTARSEYCHVQLPTRWWGPRNWKSLATLDSWVLGVLEKLRQLILALEGQLRELEGQLKARVRGQVLPKGLGELTLVTVDSEICDWRRFSNRKQVGSYTGCCPSEHSSGGQRRLGSIDRMGNGRVRALLVEAVWRFLRWQPQWQAAQRMKVKLADGSSMRKKTVIALARQLAIDLWRWRTGRATFEDLGWVPA